MSELFAWDWSFVSVELPALVAMVALIWQMKREQERALGGLKETLLGRMDALADKITDVRVVMAEMYVSKRDMRALDRRLGGQIAHIETLVSTQIQGTQTTQQARRLGG